MAVIRGDSCFEKNAFEDTENPHPLTKTRLPVKEYLGEIFEISKKIVFYFEALPYGLSRLPSPRSETELYTCIPDQ